MEKLTVLFAVLPSVALAHADRSEEALSLSHLASSPFHDGLTPVYAVGVGAVVRALRKKQHQGRQE